MDEKSTEPNEDRNVQVTDHQPAPFASASIDLSKFLVQLEPKLAVVQPIASSFSIQSYADVLEKALCKNNDASKVANRAFRALIPSTRFTLSKSAAEFTKLLGQSKVLQDISGQALGSIPPSTRLSIGELERNWSLAIKGFWSSTYPANLAISGLSLGQLALKYRELLHGLDTGFYSSLFKKFKSRKALALPPNLRQLYLELDQDQVQNAFLPFIRYGGIPAFGVPRTSTLLKLINADPRELRNVMWSHRHSIYADCYEWISDKEIQELVPIARKAESELLPIVSLALKSKGADFRFPAQTALTVFIDTLNEKLLSHNVEIRKSVKNYDPNKNDGIPDFLLEQSSAAEISEMEDFITWLPVCHAYKPFRPGKGHDIPRAYNRHASTHTLEEKQFVKRNVIQALMLATSLIVYTYTKKKRKESHYIS